MKELTIEQKAEAYDKALKAAIVAHKDEDRHLKATLEKIFPELKEGQESGEESNDIIKCLINGMRFYYEDNEEATWGTEKFSIKVKDILSWLEKQGKNNKHLYIRFGDIPKDEKSKVYNGEVEIGTENGVSVYPAFEDLEGNIVLGLSLPITKTSLYTQQHLLEYDNRSCYLVSGDYVGKGTDGEPLLKNVKIIREIKNFRVKKDEQKPFDYENANIQQKDFIQKAEPKFKIKYAGNEYNVFEIKYIAGVMYYGIEDEPNHIDYVQAENCELISGYSIPTKPIIFSEQKPADGFEPKFKVGEWVVSPNGVYWHIDRIENNRYEVTSDTGKCADWPLDTDLYHLWTIKDAKEGDVLFQDLMGGKTFIYNGINPDMAMLYSFIISNDGKDVLPYHIGKPNTGIGNIEENKNIIHPATKEQRDLLFQKMHEAGYEWDAEKKELKKISQRMISAEAKEAMYGKPTAWSEEDEEIYSRICYLIHSAAFENYDVDEVGKELGEYAKITDWLKTIKTRCAWKPSDEQMKALSTINVTGDISYAGQGQELIDLYKNLKKLRGE